VPLQAEEYDFVVPESRFDRPAVRLLREILAEAEGDLRSALAAQGFVVAD
jgi:molybdate-binding protein